VRQTQYIWRVSNPYRYERSFDVEHTIERFVAGDIEQQAQIFQDYVYAVLTAGDAAAYARVAQHCRQL
jgi:hypothetical protein